MQKQPIQSSFKLYDLEILLMALNVWRSLPRFLEALIFTENLIQWK